MNHVRNNCGFIVKLNIKFMIKKIEIFNGVKKYIIPIMLVSLVLTGASCGDDDKSSRREREEDIYENYLAVENNDWGFEVKYPDDWEKEILGEDTTGIIVGFRSPRADDSDMFAENITLLAYMPQPQDFDEMMQIGIDEVSKSPGTTLFSSRKVMVSGHLAYVLEYSVTDYTTEFKYLHYFIDGGDYWYQILYTSEISEYNKSLNIAKKIIESFIIK